MPTTPEIEEKLRLEQEAKKRGAQPTFANAGAGNLHPVTPDPRDVDPSITEDLLAMEAGFGQLCVALEAQLRVMRVVLGQLQRARMRAFGVTETRAGSMHDAPHVGQDGFITNQTTNQSAGGSNGNVSG